MDTIGRYQIVEKLGHGGMGTVYKAFDPLLARVVAIKVISTHLDSGPEHRERFFREARAAAHLSHRNIITVHDLGEHNGTPFLAMEYLEGRDLERRMRGEDPLPLARKLEVALEVCEGLGHAHALGIVHRDIKPANIFITNAGHVKILDFGLARLVSSELTSSNMMLGTVNYMAPEQLKAERVDHRADVFSLGAVLYEVLSGRKAFLADSFASTMYKILQETPEPLTAVDPTLPPALNGIVERAMAKSRDERYQSVLDLQADLEPIYRSLEGTEGAHTPRSGYGTPRPPSHPGVDDSIPTGAFDAVTVAEDLRGPRTGSGSGSRAGGSGAAASAARGSAARSGVAGTAAEAAPEAPGRRPVARGTIVAAALAVVALVAVGLWWARAGRQPASIERAASPGPSSGAPSSEAGAGRTSSGGSAAPAQPSATGNTTNDAGAGSLLADAHRRAQAALDAGRYEEAGRAAGDALRIDAADPEALAMLTTLNARVRQSADDAVATLESAKRAAIAAGAQKLAPAAFRIAERQERSARDLYKKREYGTAAAALYDATRSFREAATAAAAGTRAEADSRSDAGRAAPAPPPAPLPAPVDAAPGPPERREAAERPAPAERPEPPERNERAAAPRPEPVQLPPAQTTPPPQEAIAAVLQRYAAALERRDLAQLKAVWPGMTGTEQAAIEDNFKNARSIDVDLSSPRIEVSGNTAIVHTVRTYVLQTRDGQRLQSKAATTLTLRRTGSAWAIDSIRFEQR